MKEIFTEWGQNLEPWIVTHGIRIGFILVGAYILNLVLRRIVEKAVRLAIIPNNPEARESERKREDTLIRVLKWSISIVIFIVAIIMVLAETGLAIGPVLAGAGIVGLAVGFGGQYLIRDLISGFFIILENQYRLGDVVRFDNTSGVVEDISLRVTKLRDLDGTVHHVPHGAIQRVSNLSKNFSRINLNIGVAYQSELEKVIEVINRVGRELGNDPQWRPFIIHPPQFLRVEDFTDTAMIIKILGEVQPLKQWEVTGELRKRIKLTFDKEGIVMPFTQKILHHVKEETDKQP